MRSSLKKGLILGSVVLALTLSACIPPWPPPPAPAKATGAGAATKSGEPAAKVTGDPNAGKTLMTSKGCIACHVAQGVPGAVGTIGPSLNGLGDTGKRPTLASGEPNTPANIKVWIKDPQAKKPGTMMPNLGLSDKETDDLTAFLLTLR